MKIQFTVIPNDRRMTSKGCTGTLDISPQLHAYLRLTHEFLQKAPPNTHVTLEECATVLVDAPKLMLSSYGLRQMEQYCSIKMSADGDLEVVDNGHWTSNYITLEEWNP
jgi:hypothetical protein